MKRAQNDRDFYTWKEHSEVTDDTEGAPGERNRPRNPEKMPTTRCGTIALMFTGMPTVNGDHFKRSRPQCVYLANVKFTCGKGGTRIDTSRRHLAACFCVAPRDTNPIVLCRGRHNNKITLQPRNAARVFSHCGADVGLLNFS